MDEMYYCMQITAAGDSGPITEDTAKAFSAELLELMSKHGITLLNIQMDQVADVQMQQVGPVDKAMLN